MELKNKSNLYSNSELELINIIRAFQIQDKIEDIQIYGSGHINDTYLIKTKNLEKQYILQKINKNIFNNPAQLMDNIQRVLKHIHNKYEKAQIANIKRKVLSLISTYNNEPVYRDKLDEYWRIYIFIDNTESYEFVETKEHAFTAGRLFGEFQKLLIDLPGDNLYEIIPDFHNTLKRYKQFENIIKINPVDRVGNAKYEIEFAIQHKSILNHLGDLYTGELIPQRIIHNDAKINNILFDKTVGEGLCIVDMDTVMPGLTLYDIGDLIRTSISRHKEDEENLSIVKIDMSLFDGLISGYLSSAGEFLNLVEKENLLFGGKLIIFEQGLRFLTDYLAGDKYYKTHYKEQNLYRTRTQFKLLELILSQENELNNIIREYIR